MDSSGGRKRARKDSGVKRRKTKAKRPKGRIADHPAMQELATIVADLPPDRRAALGDFLKRPPLSDQLRDAIEAAPITRYRLAKLTGVSQSMLSRFVSGRVSLSLDSTDKVCAVLALELKPAKRLNGKNR